MRTNDEEYYKLRSTSLKVYLYLLEQNEPQGPREITRALSLSSPSVAYYHLRKLEELGLVKKTREGYVAIPGAKIEGYITLGRKILPKLKFYALLYTGILLVELAGLTMTLLNGQLPKPELIILIVITLLTIVIFIRESRI